MASNTSRPPGTGIGASGAVPPTRRNFLPENSALPPEPPSDPAVPPASATASATPPDSSAIASRTRKPAHKSAPVQEPAPGQERVSKAFRIPPALLEDWKRYIRTLPRHVLEQDVAEFMMGEFLQRKPPLPDHLLNPLTP